jgi:hypothetical protein
MAAALQGRRIVTKGQCKLCRKIRNLERSDEFSAKESKARE